LKAQGDDRANSYDYQEEVHMAIRKAREGFEVSIVLQVVMAVFLITLGLIGIINWNSGLAQFGRDLNRVFGRPSNPINLIAAILELVAGVIVLAAVFIYVRSRLLYVATLIIAILWIVRIIISLFAQELFEPNFLAWLNRFSADLIVLTALWLVNRKYA
jgi:hypothetical protein